MDLDKILLPDKIDSTTVRSENFNLKTKHLITI